jgi:hypothetical protein
MTGPNLLKWNNVTCGMQPEDRDTRSPNQSTQVLYPHRQARKGILVMNLLTTAHILNERGTDTPGCVSSMR